ncbi:MAG: S8 family serine peptidase [Actinomycetota bacterium]|nr:S8 family serine peptidase [Actinomycetota bacterium]
MSVWTSNLRLVLATVAGVLLLAALGLVFAAPAHAQGADGDFVEGELVVKIDSRSGATIEQINAQYNTRVKESLLENCSTCAKIYLLEITDGSTTGAKVEEMEGDQRLSYAEPNIITESPEGDKRHNARPDGTPTLSPDPVPYSNQYAVGTMNLSEAHGISRGGGAVVAVLDTGVQFDHPELAGSFTAARYDFADDDGVPADEGNGADDDGDGEIDEQVGHGTHVVGIVHLTAPEAKIMPLRVLDSDGTGNVFLIAEAIQYAVRNNADVINLSLGSRRESELLEDVFEDLEAEDDDDDDESEALVGVPPEGVVVVGAAGNDGTDAPQYPAAEEGVIGVLSVNGQEKKSEFSNYGTATESWVDVSAPGDGIHSPFPTGQYASWSGTSMATPFVAGQAALIRGERPTLPSTADGGQQSVEGVIERTARSIDAKNPDFTGKLGAGHADAGASLRALNTAPVISALKPQPGNKIKDRRPTVSATVRDAQTDLTKSNIRLYLDGRRKTFSYDGSRDRMTHKTGKLSFGRHSVRVVARDAQGLVRSKVWAFKVVRRG